KQEKLEEIETIITETIKKFGLESKFANQLDVDEQYLNKSFSINQAKETIEFRANNLLNEQKLEIMNRENIESFVKLKNSKQEKLEEIETIITETIKKFGLESKFANQLDVDEQYLNKSFSINQAKETIEFRANNLLNEQKLEIMNRENIESFVKLKNSEHE